jgi:gamma-glutamylcyclotransferase (GGCT)/AIG2-like uncharacterized protein YtfP
MPHLFTYGTLSDPPFMRRLLGYDVPRRLASLQGYKKIAIHGFEYPAIIPDPNHQVAGIVYFNLPEKAWLTLDAYEGPTYARRPVTVKFEDGDFIETQTYVWKT